MTIYIDPTFNASAAGYRTWSHLATDGDIEELHEFAKSIGMKREWFQNDITHPHYDIASPRIRRLAIDKGAKLISSEELVRICFMRRK